MPCFAEAFVQLADKGVWHCMRQHWLLDHVSSLLLLLLLLL
jgi:hypothetical protein